MINEPTNFLQLLFKIDMNPDGRLVDIGLENAVTAIHRAIGADIENLISATDAVSGPRTRLQKGSGEPDQSQCLLVGFNGGNLPAEIPLPHPLCGNPP
jgi:hypothetical protein